MPTFAISSTQLAGMEPPPAEPVSVLKRLNAANHFDSMPLAAYEQLIYRPKSRFERRVLVSDPEGVRRVLLENVANYPKVEMDRRLLSAMFGDGLLSSEGETWSRHRKIVAPTLDSRSVSAYIPVITDCVREFEARWDALGSGAEFDIGAEMSAITLNIVCRIMFSSDAGELASLAGPALGFAQESMRFRLFDFLPVLGPARMRAKQRAIHEKFSRMDGAIYRMIAARRERPEDAPADLLTKLIAAKNSAGTSALTAAEIRDEILTILIAGHETTAVVLTWIWYVLSQLGSEAEKLHAELDAVLGDQALAPSHLPRLAYTRMMIEETMRLYPPVPVLSARTALQDDEICGMKVARGTSVLIFPWILHRHRRLWENPERFEPERFSPARAAGRPRFAFLPFGGGARACIGATFAMTETTLVLASLARRFQPRLMDSQHIKLQTRITLRPEGGMKMILQRRPFR